MSEHDESDAYRTMVVLNPAVEPAAQAVKEVNPNGSPALAMAPRLRSLAGKRLALLDNSKVRAKELLTALGDRLRDQCGVAEVKIWRKPAAAMAAPFMSELLQWKPDFVLTASGD